jgi:hypothetical protein
MNRFVSILTLILSVLTLRAGVVSAQPVAKSGPPPIPTMQDLNDMYAAAQYRTCVQQIARVLNLKTPAAQDYDRGALLALRGDCLLNLGDRTGAIKAYTDAQKTKQPEAWCHARAMELLVRSGKYKPKPAAAATGSTAAADPDPAAGVADDIKMKQAMMDLLDVQRKRAEPKMRAAEQAQNLTPMIDALPEMMDLYALEKTSTGDVADIAPRMKDIGQRARSMIGRELSQLDVRVQQLEAMANSSVDTSGRGGGGLGRGGGGGGRGWSDSTRRGLFSNERDGLRDTLDYVAKIQATAERGQRIANDFGGQPEAWDQLISQCGLIQARAEGLLDSN